MYICNEIKQQKFFKYEYFKDNETELRKISGKRCH